MDKDEKDSSAKKKIQKNIQEELNQLKLIRKHRQDIYEKKVRPDIYKKIEMYEHPSRHQNANARTNSQLNVTDRSNMSLTHGSFYK